MSVQANCFSQIDPTHVGSIQARDSTPLEVPHLLYLQVNNCSYFKVLAC